MPRRIFVTGIGTGVGKTLVSAVLVKALKAEYWKPIQSGDLDGTDSDCVNSLCGGCVCHPESYRLKMPASPNIAAGAEDIEIALDKIRCPETKSNLIIEGAGGIFVPLNRERRMTDLMRHLEAEVILVSQGYLGCINHTLLSIEALRNLDLPLRGIIVNGEMSSEVERTIVDQSAVKVLGRIPSASAVNAQFVSQQATQFASL